MGDILNISYKLSIYLNILYNDLNNANIALWSYISYFVDNVFYIYPYFVKYLIGYCHFYYQLGCGLIFYIYMFRRYKAKKTKNWKSFYGNSVSNWFLISVTFFKNSFFTKQFFLFIGQKILLYIKIINIWLIIFFKDNINYKLFKTHTNKYFNKRYIFSFWTPIFKKSSYINFYTFLNKFIKRK